MRREKGNSIRELCKSRAPNTIEKLFIFAASFMLLLSRFSNIFRAFIYSFFLSLALALLPVFLVVSSLYQIFVALRFSSFSSFTKRERMLLPLPLLSVFVSIISSSTRRFLTLFFFLAVLFSLCSVVIFFFHSFDFTFYVALSSNVRESRFPHAHSFLFSGITIFGAFFQM